jgi:hypothetical protein
MSSATSVNDALIGYAAGRMTAQQLVGAVAAEYYRETRNGKRETLRAIMDVVERAHPGVVELKASEAIPGFDVRLAERPFPKRFEAELKQAVERVLQMVVGAQHAAPVPDPSRTVPPPTGILARIIRAIRKVFSA